MDNSLSVSSAMHESSLMGLPQFLSYLSTFPPPSKAVEALLFGPLLRFHARASALWILENNLLRLVAAPGHDSDEIKRWAIVDVTIDAPAANCVRDSTIQIYSREALLAGMASMLSASVEDPLVDAVFFGFDRSVDNGGGDVVVVPVSVNGSPIAVLGFMLNEHHDWSTPDLALLSTIGFGLGLWLTNPNTPEPRRFIMELPAGYVAMALTLRQKKILLLVEEGLANAQIANALNVSISTVKQELHKIAVSLDVVHRHDAARRARDIGLLGV